MQEKTHKQFLEMVAANKKTEDLLSSLQKKKPKEEEKGVKY